MIPYVIWRKDSGNIFQAAGTAVDKVFASFSTSTDTKISDAKVSGGTGNFKVTTSIDVTNTTTVRTGFGDLLSLNSQNTPMGPFLKVTNTTEISKQTKIEGSTTVRGVDIKATNTTNVGLSKVTNTTEVMAGKSLSSSSGKTSASAGAFLSVKNTSSNNKTTSQTTVGLKASVTYSPTKSTTVTHTAKLGVDSN